MDFLARNWPWMCALAVLWLLWRLLAELREVRVELRLIERQMPESMSRRAQAAREHDEHGEMSSRRSEGTR